MSRTSVRGAQHAAQILKRCGYPEAQAAPEYCIDAGINEDGFYTYTISVHAGPYKPETIPNVLKTAMQQTKSRLGWD